MRWLELLGARPASDGSSSRGLVQDKEPPHIWQGERLTLAAARLPGLYAAHGLCRCAGRRR